MADKYVMCRRRWQMDLDGEDKFNELAWLAFVAQQHGWDGLADRIADDVAASKERQDQLESRRRRFAAEVEDEDHRGGQAA